MAVESERGRLMLELRAVELGRLRRWVSGGGGGEVGLVGGASSGASAVVTELLATDGRPFARVALSEAGGDVKLLMSLILSRLADFYQSDGLEQKVASASDFQHRMRELTRRWAGFFVVLEEAEKLGPMASQLLGSLRLLRAGRSGRWPTPFVLLVSRCEVEWELAFRCPWPIPPFRLRFPAWDKRQLVRLLAARAKDTVLHGADEAELFKAFALNLIECMGAVSRELGELEYAAGELWPLFVGPLRRGEVAKGPKAAAQLWLRARDRIRAAFNGLYIREGLPPEPREAKAMDTDEPKERRASLVMPRAKEQDDLVRPIRSFLSLRQESAEAAAEEDREESGLRGASGLKMPLVELPGMAKWVLCAAYAASYNPPASDKRFFSLTKSGRQRKARAGAGVGEAHGKTSAHVQGPHLFGLERAEKILRFLLQEAGVKAPTDLPYHLATLCRSGLVARASALGNLDAPKFRCLVQLETIRITAQSLRLPITQYLLDFAQ